MAEELRGVRITVVLDTNKARREYVVHSETLRDAIDQMLTRSPTSSSA